MRSRASVSNVHPFLELMRAFLRRNLRGDEVNYNTLAGKRLHYIKIIINKQINYYKRSAINYESVDLSFQVRSTPHSALLHNQKRLFQANAYAFYMRMDR
ncbi:hypothetical protein ALC56_09716 [Trachymyrmex septentrionalis]|uniref:Uncharacterized protein n=1 Tax=Trachymyrmex septentrionalis TaxID=34720 RepID=A0A195F5Q8_9HYME|nr:hypothetical protein ALC56_09716 [Trachymyrmex septentrionalis]